MISENLEMKYYFGGRTSIFIIFIAVGATSFCLLVSQAEVTHNLSHELTMRCQLIS